MVSVMGDSCSTNALTFNVVAPSSITYQRVDNIYHINGWANIGIHSTLYLQPDGVSFSKVYVRELDALAVADGVWICINNTSHDPTVDPSQVGDDVPGLGSPVVDTIDRADSGSCGVATFPASSETFNIPNVYSVGASGASHQFVTIAQMASLTDAGALTMSKNGSSGTTTINSPTSTY